VLGSIGLGVNGALAGLAGQLSVEWLSNLLAWWVTLVEWLM